MIEFRCTRVDHQDFQIQGSCENVNCLQQYRRVCLKCIPLHRLNDKDFKDDDIKTSDDLTNLFNMFRNEKRDMMNSIFLQCNIQNMILLTEIIVFINIWSQRQQRLMRIQTELQQFEQQYWGKINILNYINDENSNQGVYKFLENIADQLMKVQNQMDDYIKQIESNNQEIDVPFKKSQTENVIQNLFENTLQLLQDYQENTYQRLRNKLLKEKEKNDNPYVCIFEILMKQGKQNYRIGYNLSSNVPRNQFNQVRNLFLNQIKDYQDYYLQGITSDQLKAFSIVYSINSQQHLDESLKLISKSIQLNDKYSKAQYLKGIIQFDKKQFEDAIKSFNQCIKLDNQYSLLHSTKLNYLKYCILYLQYPHFQVMPNFIFQIIFDDHQIENKGDKEQGISPSAFPKKGKETTQAKVFIYLTCPLSNQVNQYLKFINSSYNPNISQI